MVYLLSQWLSSGALYAPCLSYLLPPRPSESEDRQWRLDECLRYVLSSGGFDDGLTITADLRRRERKLE